MIDQDAVSKQDVDSTATPESTTLPTPSRSGIKWLVAVLVIVAVGFIVKTTFFSNNQISNESTVEETQPVKVTKRDTVLSIAVKEAVSGSQSTTIPVLIDTGENTVSAIELHIAMNPYKKQTVKVTSGSFFASPTILENTFDKETGVTKLVIGSLSPKKGTGILALLEITSLGVKTETEISITNDTKAAALGEESTVVKELQSGTILL